MMTLWKRFWHYISLKNAISQANKLKKLTNKKHWVIKIFNKIRVLDRMQINYLIASEILHPKLKRGYEIDKISLYHTK